MKVKVVIEALLDVPDGTNLPDLKKEIKRKGLGPEDAVSIQDVQLTAVLITT